MVIRVRMSWGGGGRAKLDGMAMACRVISFGVGVVAASPASSSDVVTVAASAAVSIPLCNAWMRPLLAG